MTKKEKRFWLVEGVTRREVERSLADTRFNFFRTRKARKALVVIMSIMIAIKIIAPLLPSDVARYVEFFGFPPILLGYFAVRSSVRHVADSPDELLDERQIKVRDRSYMHSYRIIIGVFCLLIPVISTQVDINGGHFVKGGLWLWNIWVALAFLMAALPSMVIAWNDKSKEL